MLEMIQALVEAKTALYILGMELPSEKRAEYASLAVEQINVTLTTAQELVGVRIDMVHPV